MGGPQLEEERAQHWKKRGGKSAVMELEGKKIEVSTVPVDYPKQDITVPAAIQTGRSEEKTGHIAFPVAC